MGHRPEIAQDAQRRGSTGAHIASRLLFRIEAQDQGSYCTRVSQSSQGGSNAAPHACVRLLGGVESSQQRGDEPRFTPLAQRQGALPSNSRVLSCGQQREEALGGGAA